jgi:uncharacterized protein
MQRPAATWGEMYYKGAGVPKDILRAANLFGKVCERGSATGCDSLHGIYEFSLESLGQEVEDRSELLEKDCDGGDADACSELGLGYSEWAGHPDPGRAAKFQREGCDGADANACLYIGSDYQNGDGGLRKNYDQAVEFYKKACDDGRSEACAFLGFAYERDKMGLPKDPGRAAEFLKKGCDGGDGPSCRELKNGQKQR